MAMTIFPAIDVKYRILTTGSRGKSSLVRLLFAGLAAKGLNVRGRITGVLPRELSAHGIRSIVRNSPGHISEARWWLGQIPSGTDAVVMENSAVHPELQPLAARWLRPTLIILTNTREDHQEVWGKGRAAAEEALLRGIPDGVPLIVGAEVMTSPRLAETLLRRNPPAATAPDSGNFRLANLSIARKAMDYMGFLDEDSDRAMRQLPPDIGDFRIFYPDGGISLAVAFSANDPESSERLFSLLGWKESETSVVFSDRGDRPARRVGFEPFLKRDWREVLVFKDKGDSGELRRWMRGKQVFGCGNIAGAPLKLLLELTEEGCEWTIPGA